MLRKDGGHRGVESQERRRRLALDLLAARVRNGKLSSYDWAAGKIIGCKGRRRQDSVGVLEGVGEVGTVLERFTTACRRDGVGRSELGMLSLRLSLLSIWPGVRSDLRVLLVWSCYDSALIRHVLSRDRNACYVTRRRRTLSIRALCGLGRCEP